MHAAAILFPLGVRISTWVVVLAFVALAVKRRDSTILLAAWVWLVGFEAAFDGSVLAMGYGFEADRVLPIVLGAFTVGWWLRTRPFPASLPLLAAVAVIWAVWLGLGFPWNAHTGIGFRWDAEVLNEAAKTLWALAYLGPLWRMKAPLKTPPLRGLAHSLPDVDSVR